jgi:hypothetical protein
MQYNWELFARIVPVLEFFKENLINTDRGKGGGDGWTVKDNRSSYPRCVKMIFVRVQRYWHLTPLFSPVSKFIDPVRALKPGGSYSMMSHTPPFSQTISNLGHAAPM